jgi:hypothetical protein
MSEPFDFEDVPVEMRAAALVAAATLLAGDKISIEYPAQILDYAVVEAVALLRESEGILWQRHED